MLNRSTSLTMSTSILKALPGKLDIKRHEPSILNKKFRIDSQKDGFNWCEQYEMGLVARKPVFGVSDKASFKPISSATETS